MESEDLMLYFKHTFQDLLFTYINLKWAEYYDQISYTMVCNLYNIYSCALDKSLIADVPAWSSNCGHLLEAIGISLEAAFVNDSCFQIKRLVSEILDFDISTNQKQPYLVVHAGKEIGKMLEVIATKVSTGNSKFWTVLVERVCVE